MCDIKTFLAEAEADLQRLDSGLFPGWRQAQSRARWMILGETDALRSAATGGTDPTTHVHSYARRDDLRSCRRRFVQRRDCAERRLLQRVIVKASNALLTQY